MAGTKVERIAVGGYYANSLTNVSCNQTAIYQSINSTIESIYDRVADPLRGSTFLSFFSFPLSLFFSLDFLCLASLRSLRGVFTSTASRQEVEGAMGNNSVCKRLSSKLFLNSITAEMDYLVYRWTSFCEMNRAGRREEDMCIAS